MQISIKEGRWIAVWPDVSHAFARDQNEETNMCDANLSVQIQNDKENPIAET